MIEGTLKWMAPELAQYMKNDDDEKEQEPEQKKIK